MGVPSLDFVRNLSLEETPAICQKSFHTEKPQKTPSSPTKTAASSLSTKSTEVPLYQVKNEEGQKTPNFAPISPLKKPLRQTAQNFKSQNPDFQQKPPISIFVWKKDRKTHSQPPYLRFKPCRPVFTIISSQKPKNRLLRRLNRS